jgi:hypothetical protein
MAVLLAQRCLHHPSREAVARCPECGQFFCRECITEHDDRVVCSSCLKRLSAKKETRRRNFAPLARVCAATCGVLLAWLFFFVAGRLLLNAPAAFHEDPLWKGDWLESPEEER